MSTLMLSTLLHCEHFWNLTCHMLQNDGDDSDEIVVDLKGKAARSRRSSSLGGGSALPRIAAAPSGRSPVPPPGPAYRQLHSEAASPVERRSPSAGPSTRVDWKAKYLK